MVFICIKTNFEEFFCQNGFRVRLFYGANAPLLYQIIREEFELELKALQHLRIRVQEDFDQLLPEEISETCEKLKIQEEYERVENDRAKKEYRETRMIKSDHIMSNIYKNMKPTTLILLYPHVIRETQTIAKYLETKGFQIGEKAMVLVKLVLRLCLSFKTGNFWFWCLNISDVRNFNF